MPFVCVVCMHVSMYVSVDVYLVYGCLCIYEWVRVCMCACMCIEHALKVPMPVDAVMPHDMADLHA